MVFCPKCGKQNPDDARFCVDCGVSLYPKEQKEKRGDDCFGPRGREKEECFGLPHGEAIAGIVFGLFIVIIGFTTLFGQDVWQMVWPFAVIIIGILIVAGAIYGLSRKPK